MDVLDIAKLASASLAHEKAILIGCRTTDLRWDTLGEYTCRAGSLRSDVFL